MKQTKIKMEKYSEHDFVFRTEFIAYNTENFLIMENKNIRRKVDFPL